MSAMVPTDAGAAVYYDGGDDWTNASAQAATIAADDDCDEMMEGTNTDEDVRVVMLDCFGDGYRVPQIVRARYLSLPE